MKLALLVGTQSTSPNNTNAVTAMAAHNRLRKGTFADNRDIPRPGVRSRPAKPDLRDPERPRPGSRRRWAGEPPADHQRQVAGRPDTSPLGGLVPPRGTVPRVLQVEVNRGRVLPVEVHVDGPAGAVAGEPEGEQFRPVVHTPEPRQLGQQAGHRPVRAPARVLRVRLARHDVLVRRGLTYGVLNRFISFSTSAVLLCAFSASINTFRASSLFTSIRRASRANPSASAGRPASRADRASWTRPARSAWSWAASSGSTPIRLSFSPVVLYSRANSSSQSPSSGATLRPCSSTFAAFG